MTTKALPIRIVLDPFVLAVNQSILPLGPTNKTLESKDCNWSCSISLIASSKCCSDTSCEKTTECPCVTQCMQLPVREPALGQILITSSKTQHLAMMLCSAALGFVSSFACSQTPKSTPKARQFFGSVSLRRALSHIGHNLLMQTGPLH
jgi:hypothetical protein